MPNCFALVPRGQTERESLQKVDDKMRAAFEAPTDPDHWFSDWANVVGFALALGLSFDEVIEKLTERVVESDETLIEITKWLKANYTVEAWYSSIKK